MVKVGKVRVPMTHGLMPVPMRVQLAHRAVMAVLVVFVVGVGVLVAVPSPGAH
jgi:hypothetical protein